MTKEDFQPYKIVSLYENWQEEKNMIGTGLLLRKKRNGLPFILKDTYVDYEASTISFHDEPITEWKQVEKSLGKYNLYSYQRWDIKMIKTQSPRYVNGQIYTFNIRFFIGEVKDRHLYSDDKEKEITEEEYLTDCKKKNKSIDTFIKVNGVEIF